MLSRFAEGCGIAEAVGSSKRSRSGSPDENRGPGIHVFGQAMKQRRLEVPVLGMATLSGAVEAGRQVKQQYCVER